MWIRCCLRWRKRVVQVTEANSKIKGASPPCKNGECGALISKESSMTSAALWRVGACPLKRKHNIGAGKTISSESLLSAPCRLMSSFLGQKGHWIFVVLPSAPHTPQPPLPQPCVYTSCDIRCLLLYFCTGFYLIVTIIFGDISISVKPSGNLIYLWIFNNCCK